MRWKMIAIVAWLVAVSTTAEAAPTCAAREQLLEYFADKFSESPVAVGLGDDGKLIVVLASQSGTWSIMQSGPDGVSCIVVTGQNWRGIAAQDDGPEA